MSGPGAGPAGCTTAGRGTRLTMPIGVLEQLADAARTPLPWREPQEPYDAGDTGPVPRLLRDALATFGQARVLVTLDLLHDRGRLRSWQRLAGGRVTAVTVAGTDLAELAWFPAADWRGYLSRTVRVPGRPAAEVRAVVAARAGARDRVGWLGGELGPAAFADRVTRLVAGALS